MSKNQQAEFKRVEEFEKAFGVRYGKNVEVYRALVLDKTGKLHSATIHIIDKGEKYTLTEYLKDGATDYVMLGCARNGKEKNYKFKRYIDAEIMTADLIGQRRIEDGRLL